MNGGCWRLAPGQQLALHGWDGEYVLYNDLSGDTHLLGESAVALLRRLGAAPAPACALRDVIQDADEEEVTALLARLHLLHLVGPAPC